MSKKKQLMKIKKIGANLSVIIGKEKLAKRVNKEESASIVKNVENYNKAVEAGRAEKTIAKWEKLITDAMTTNAKRKADEKEANKLAAKKVGKKVEKTSRKKPVAKATKQESALLKDIKQNAKKETQSTLKKGIAYLEALLTKAKKIDRPQATTGRRRSGEY